MSTATLEHPGTQIKVDNARIDRLKEQHLSTPQTIDSERVRFMARVYEGTAGYRTHIPKAMFAVMANRSMTGPSVSGVACA